MLRVPGLLAMILVGSLSVTSRFGVSADDLPPGIIARLGSPDLRNRQGVEGVAFSPDSQQLASAGWGDSIRIWDLSTGKQNRRIRTGGMTFAVAFSPDGTKLASVGSNQVRLWDLDSNQELFSSDLQQERITGIAFAPDGLTFATGGAKEAVMLWDVETGDDLVHLHTTNGGQDVHPVAFSPSGALLASGDRTGTIRVWNLVTGATAKLRANDARGIMSLAFLSERELLGSVNWYDRAKRTTESSISVYSLSDDGSTLLTSYVFDSPQVELRGAVPFGLSDDRERLVSVHRDKLAVWDVPTRKVLRVIERPENSFGYRTHGVAISPDRKYVASEWGSHKVHIWDLETGDELFPQPNTHHGGLISIAVSPDKRILATGDEVGYLHLWDAKSFQHLRRITLSRNWIRSIAFLPDGKRLLTVGEYRNPETFKFEGMANIVDLEAGRVVRRIPLPDRGMHAVLSADGHRLYVAMGLGQQFFGEGGPAQIGVWDLTADGDPTLFPSGDGEVKRLILDEENQTLWTVHDTELRAWDSDSGEMKTKHAVKGAGSFGAIGFRVGAELVVAGSHEYSRKPGESKGTISAMKLADRSVTWSKEFFERSPARIAMSANGEYFAVYWRTSDRADEPAEIEIRQVSDGALLRSFSLEDGWVRSLQFSRDGARLYSGMDRGDLLIWDLSDVGLQK